LKDLYKAKEYIELAMKIIPMEKLLKSPIKILKMLNLDNMKEAYIDQAKLCVHRIEKRTSWELKAYKRTYYSNITYFLALFIRLKELQVKEIKYKEKFGEDEELDCNDALKFNLEDEYFEFNVTKE